MNKRFFLCLIAILSLLCLYSVSALASDTVEVQVTGRLSYPKANEVLSQLNTYRQANGLEELVLDPALTQAAMRRAAEQALAPGHTRPDGTQYSTLLLDISGVQAENLNTGCAAAAEVMSVWKNAVSDNANMLDSRMTHVGIGCAYVGNTWYWCQLFSATGIDDTTAGSPGDGRFLWKITVLQDNLVSSADQPGSLRVNLDPRDGQDTPTERFSCPCTYLSSSGVQNPVALIPLAFSDTSTCVHVRDSNGTVIAELTLADDSSEIIVTPLAANGTGSLALPLYAGQSNPGRLDLTIHTHNYVATIVTPTCRRQGYTVYQCTLGCNQFTAAYTDPVACASDGTVYDFRPSTCTEHGYSGYQVCQWCSAVVDPGTTLPLADHTPGDWVIQSPATETAEGLRCQYCRSCSALLATEVIPRIIRNPFTDVTSNSYCYDAVLWAVGEGITNGVTATTFCPDAGCTRGQVVTFLWRACGAPEPARTDNPFTDVRPDSYYFKAVLWAAENGITRGISDTLFSPDSICTRAQVAVFLWRAGQQPQPAGGVNPFSDVKPDTFYYTAVLWAVEEHITNGTTAVTFCPEDCCTRGQIVTFLHRARNILYAH